MCGLVSKINFNGSSVNADILYRYIAQRSRGTEGYGFAGVVDNKVIIKKAVTEKGIISKIMKYPSNAILFHHRTPTSTDNTLQSCHPFSVKVKSGWIMLAHNGVIYNAEEMYKKHKRLGISYSSYCKKSDNFNDSECLAHDFARYVNGDIKNMECEGWVAFIAFKVDKNKKLENIYFMRNVSGKLNMMFIEDSLAIGSEIDGKEIDSNKLYNFDVETKKMTTKSFWIQSYHTVETTKFDYTNYYKNKNKEDEDDYYERLAERWETGEYKGDGIIAMSDSELEKYIQGLEWDIQALESNLEGLKKKEFQNKLDQLYNDLEYADDEATERKLTYQNNGVMKLPI